MLPTWYPVVPIREGTGSNTNCSVRIGAGPRDVVDVAKPKPEAFRIDTIAIDEGMRSASVMASLGVLSAAAVQTNVTSRVVYHDAFAWDEHVTHSPASDKGVLAVRWGAGYRVVVNVTQSRTSLGKALGLAEKRRMDPQLVRDLYGLIGLTDEDEAPSKKQVDALDEWMDAGDENPAEEV
jgi:hypothetical protein